MLQDISERKRAETALLESEEQFRQLANNIPQVFWISDLAQKRTIYVSPAAENLIGRPVPEILSHPRVLVRAVHAEDRPRVYSARKTAAGAGYDESYRIVRPDGSVRWVHDRAFPVRDATGNVYRIAGITEDITEQDALIRNADTAMYRAKEVGRNSCQFYTPEMNARALELLGIESSLRRALERDEFLLYYQPKASVAGGAIVGVEALLRWRHPERGLISPAHFMPVLEETGLIVPVGEWVLKAVITSRARWRRKNAAPGSRTPAACAGPPRARNRARPSCCWWTTTRARSPCSSAVSPRTAIK